MAKAKRSRPRTLSGVFGAYFLLVIGFAYFFSGRLLSGWYDPGMIRWVCAAYVLFGALFLAGVCVGAVARQRALDLRLVELEAFERETLAVAGRGTVKTDAARPPADETPPTSESSGHDVDRLLAGLEQISEAAQAVSQSSEEPRAARGQEPRGTSILRDTRDEMARLLKIRKTVAAHVAGPALASIGLLEVGAVLLPASDGMLLANIWLNGVVVIAGLGSLVGLAVYAAAAFRQLRH